MGNPDETQATGQHDTATGPAIGKANPTPNYWLIPKK